jgi:hypothetical protein
MFVILFACSSMAFAVEGVQLFAYLSDNGVNPSEVDVTGVESPGFVILDGVITKWNVDGVDKPTVADLKDMSASRAVVKTRKQSNKSELHKIADTELVALLIEAGDIPEGSTKVGQGNPKKAIKRLLKASKGKGKSTKQVADKELSLRISQMKQIILSEGGDPDDAIVHAEE